MTASGKRLGSILLGGGVITSEQLDGALELQIISGGRLGTNLVDLRHLTVEQVGYHLGVQHRLPVASYAELFAVESAVVALVPKAQCTRYRVFPLRIEGKLLHLAMTDPGDLVAIDELTFLTGMKIAPHVTPELRMLQVLERRHSFLRERRFLRIPEEGETLDTREGAPRISMMLPSVNARAKAGPNLADPDASDVLIFLDDAIGQQPAPARAKSEPPRVSPAAPPAGVKSAIAIKEEDDDFDLIIEIEAPVSSDGAPLGEDVGTSVYGGADLGAPPLALPVEPPSGKDEATAVHLQNTLSASGILAVGPALEHAADRDEVIRLLLRPFGGAPALGVLFLVRGDMLVGQLAAATPIPQETVRRLVLPLQVPSLLQSAQARRQVVRGTARDDPMQQVIARYLRWEDPAEACVAPIVLGDRVVNLLCVQTSPGTRFEDDFASALSTLCELAAKSYARLVQRRRQLTTREIELVAQAPSRATVPQERPQFTHRRVFITGQVGSGRSTTVWRAIDVGTQKVVAVKLLPAGRLTPNRFEELVRTVETLRRLEHPCVGKLYEVGRTIDGSPYVVTEWHGGSTLKSWLTRTPTPRPNEVTNIVGQIAGALTAAHSRGVVHGNLRPSNVLFPSPDKLGLLVVDFGIPGGAPADGYQAPERAEGQSPRPAEDVYSLAVIACEMLPGPATPEKATFVARDLPPSLASLSPGTVQVILRALARHPEERPDALTFARELHRALASIS